MIPKVIHYCWFGGKKLPSDVENCIRSWRKYCPQYKIIRWDESNYNVKANKFLKSAYEAEKWAFVSDYARLDIIYNNGGIYLDTDVELIKPLDELLDSEAFFATTQSEPHQINTGLGFGAEEKNSMVKKMLAEYDNLEFSEKNIGEFVCPSLNTKPFIVFGYNYTDNVQEINGVKIYPASYFDPIGKDGVNIKPNTISIHHYSATWEKPLTRFKRKVAISIGPGIEGKMKKMRRKLNFYKV